MEQNWTAFWARVSDAFHQALAPFRAVAGAFGQHPSDIQIWCFLCGVFFLAVVAIQTYGDIMLRRRGAFATGKVIGIDKSSDGPDTPIIEFADRLGKTWRFGSHLPVNGTTGNVGAVVEVIYDPLHPKRAREVGRLLMKAVHLAVWYAVVAGLMVLAFLPGLFFQLIHSGGEAQAAVAGQHLAGHETVGHQEGDRVGDVLGAADTADRRLSGVLGKDRLPLFAR